MSDATATSTVVEPPPEAWASMRPPYRPDVLLTLQAIADAAPEDAEMYVRPTLNGYRPDFVLLQPGRGIVVGSFVDVADLDEEVPSAVLGADLPMSGPLDPVRKLHVIREAAMDLFAPSLPRDRRGFSKIKAAVIVLDVTSRLEALRLLSPCLAKQNKFHVADTTVVGREDASRLWGVLPRSSESFVGDAVEEVRWWLREPHMDHELRTDIAFTGRQREVVEGPGSSGMRRVKGAAGSGKSLALAGRAAELEQSGKRVLVVTYNITLIGYLRHLIRRAGGRANAIRFDNFHAWCKREMTDAGCADEYRALWARPHAALNDELAAAVSETNVRADQLYDAILVDEGQDFRLSWWKALRTRLAPGGEMLLVADKAQDVYQQGAAWTEAPMPGSGFAGGWFELPDSWRTPPASIPLLRSFLQQFSRNIDGLLLPTDNLMAQLELEAPTGATRLIWRQTSEVEYLAQLEAAATEVHRLAMEHGQAGHRVDMALLTDRNLDGLEVAHRLEQASLRVNYTYAEGSAGRRAKALLTPTAGVINATTIQSFKGWEAPLLVVGIRYAHHASVVYTGLSRLVRSTTGCTLVVVCADERYEDWAREQFPEFVAA